MLVNFFGKSKPINYVFISIIFIFFYILNLFKGSLVIGFYDNVLLNYTINIFLIIWYFFFLNFILEKNNLTFDNSYAYLLFVILISFIPASYLNNLTLILGLILLFFLRKVYSLQSPKNVLKKVFDASLWVGFAFIFENWSVVFILFIYLAVFIHNKVNFRTIIIPFVGFITIPFLYFTYCFFSDNLEGFLKIFNFRFSVTLSYKGKLLYLISVIGFLVLICSSLKTIYTLPVKNSFRKNWILILSHLLLTITFVFLLVPKNDSELLFLMFPSAIILANGMELLEKKKKRLVDVIIYVSLAVSVVFNLLF